MKQENGEAMGELGEKGSGALSPGWLQRDLEAIRKDVASWPDWMKRALREDSRSLQDVMRQQCNGPTLEVQPVANDRTELERLREEVKVLRNKLEQAPHGEDCMIDYWVESMRKCDCWKATC